MSDDHRAALREKPTIGLRFRDIERYRSFMAISSDDRFSNDRADDRQQWPRSHVVNRAGCEGCSRD
jgi:hypothetical protein